MICPGRIVLVKLFDSLSRFPALVAKTLPHIARQGALRSFDPLLWKLAPLY